MVGACGSGAHGAGRPAAESARTLHKGEHAAAIGLRAVPGIGGEIVLTVDGELRTGSFRSHQQAELVGAIADTRTRFEGKGWA